MNEGLLIPAMWTAWAIYWRIASRGVKPVQRRESVLSRAGHIVPTIAAVVLLVPQTLPGNFLCERFLPRANLTFYSGAVMLAMGLAFAIWARVFLGRNWSGTVTLKQDHELIRSGPYAIVRHPIYTGLLLGFLGSAVARGEWRGLLAVAIIFATYWRKLRLEERWMQELFGDAYARYRAEVPALIPGIL